MSALAGTQSGSQVGTDQVAMLALGRALSWLVAGAGGFCGVIIQVARTLARVSVSRVVKQPV